MRSIVWVGFVGCLGTACGSASNDALFHSKSENVCNAQAGCATPSNGGAGGAPSANGGSDNSGGQSEPAGSGGAAGATATGGAGSGGATGSGGSPGTGGGQDGSGGRIDAGADRGSGGSGPVECPDGKYHAVLTGQYKGSTGTRDIGATIDFTVTREGTVTGTFAGPGGAKATVTGSMNCSTRELTSKVEDGSYTVLIVPVRFSGTFDGTYDSGADAFDGMWAMTESGTAGSGGTGPWTTH